MAIVVFAIIVCLITVLPSFAAEKTSLVIHGEDNSGAVTIWFAPGYTWEDVSSNDYRVVTYDEGFVTINGKLLTDGSDPIFRNEIVSSDINYVWEERTIKACELRDAESYRVVYSFNYPQGMTFAEFRSYEIEHGISTRIDVTAEHAHYRTACTNYTLYMQNVSSPTGSTPICELLMVGSSSDIQFHNGDLTEEVTQAPDCYNNGEKLITCNECGFSWTATVSKTEHDFELISHIDPTCAVEGEDFYECSICGDSKTDIIDRIEHAYELTEHADATCTVCGENIYECTACGERTTESIDELGHDLNLLGSCKRDGCSYNRFTGTGDDPDGSENIFASVQNWFSGISTTLSLVFKIVLAAFGIILFCIVGIYIVRFIRELSSARKKR